jgi:hypothetical protein
MSLNENIKTHTDAMLLWGKQDLFIERRFTTAESWNRTSTEESFRFRGIFRDREPVLQQLLSHSSVLILGEPGSGKSSIAKAAVHKLASSGNSTPVPAFLKSYRGDLRRLLEQSTPPEILDAANTHRTYVLDGLDEVPSTLLDRFAAELTALKMADPKAAFVITSRQAFHAKHPSALPIECDVFHILDFGDSDVKRFVEAHGVRSEDFAKAISDAQCEEEITNPFILSVMVERYKEIGQFSTLRSENVAYMIDRLIATRPNVNPKRQRRALRMLGVACETYCRNELTEAEALQVLLEAIEISESQAREILDELSHSILIRTSNGIAFQMRSYGEFLAAEELESQPLDRVKELAFFDSDIPNDSWMNAMSYLAEMNAPVRRYFLRNHPEWMFSASPAAFSEDERRTLCSGFIDQLNRSGQLVIDQEMVRPRKLARLLPDSVLEELIGKIESPQLEEAANALALVGIRGRKEIVPLSVKLAKQTERADPLRYAAIVALVNAGDYTVIDELISAFNPGSPHHINLVDCIGSLARPQDIPKVLPLLRSTDAMLSATYYRFREFRSREFVALALEYLRDRPTDFQARRVDAYLEPAVEQIPEYWDHELEELCARIIFELDIAHVYPQPHDFARKFTDAIERSKPTENFARTVLSHFISAGRQVVFYSEIIGRFITPAIATWLISVAPTDLVTQMARATPDPRARSILQPTSEQESAAQRQWQEQYLEEQRVRAEQHKTEIEEKRATISTSDKFAEVVTQLHSLEKGDWPDIAPERLRRLASSISEELLRFDLEKNITHSGTSWTSPTWLHPLLEIVGHYSLQLPDDSTLVLALLAWPENSITEYYQKHGFTEKARGVLKQILARGTNHPHVITNFLAFLESAKYPCDELLPELKRIATDSGLESYMRTRAVGLIGTVGDPKGLLEELRATTGDSGVARTSFLLLVERQDRATIERALSTLAADDAALIAGENSSGDISPSDWIGTIRESFAWKKLVDIRAKSLALELPNLAQMTTDALKRIDPNQLPQVIRDQLSKAPASWRRRQQMLAVEYEREARLMRARSTPFEVVIAKLKGSTSMITLKVWCEGVTDRPIFRALFQELGEERIADTLDFVGGWPQLIAEREPERWLDGCRRAVIIMDADNGRNLTKPKRPETNMAKEIRRRFAAFPIDLNVLQRYGIENYFPQTACEKVLGRDLSSYFPIPETTPIEDHFIERSRFRNRVKIWLQKMLRRKIGKSQNQFFFKNRHNGQIAQHLTLADIAGSDLEEIVTAISKEAQAISGS